MEAQASKGATYRRQRPDAGSRWIRPQSRANSYRTDWHRGRSPYAHLATPRFTRSAIRLVNPAAHEASIAFRNAVSVSQLASTGDASRVSSIAGRNIASVGLTEEQARTRFSAFRVLRAPFSDNARANAEVRHARPRQGDYEPDGRILGCWIVGHRAHDLIVPWGLAMAKGLRASDLAESCPAGQSIRRSSGRPRWNP